MIEKRKMYRYRNSIERTFFTVLLDFCLLDFSEEKNMARNKMPLFSLKVRCEKKSLFKNAGGSPKIGPPPPPPKDPRISPEIPILGMKEEPSSHLPRNKELTIGYI